MIIRNALIHDAIHEEPFYGDIVITDGRLVSVGGTAGNEDVAIDATGLHAYPGFVDAQLMRSSSLTLPRAVDAELLRSSALKTLAELGDIELVTYRDL